MRHLITLDDWTTGDLHSVFRTADLYRAGSGPHVNGSAALFFPQSSLRTRVSFERGTALMGLQPITFPPETLDREEALIDVVGYLSGWVDLLIVRHPDLAVLEGLARSDLLPVINAMTSENHPCEVLSDLYALSQRSEPRALRYLFVGPDGNIGRAWREASRAFGLDLTQSCPASLAMRGVQWNEDLFDAASRADVILTDSPGDAAPPLASYIITQDVLAVAPTGVRLAPCPPFLRGRELTDGALSGRAFVGYEFKRSLLAVQQAVVAHALGVSE
ncbi:ornithine carbamoyltransferase [Plantibacter sp. Mn2098]|uniref:ornithine carbamoyltransferase n=1 Tax=Plantibacter sp. Mn2098 TaxID=3395266 RepID=UPI003BCE19DF